MHRWKISALAAAAFVSAALTTTDASALVLGTLSVRSALGENLNAEITLPQATATELNSLTAQIASAEIFRAQGLDYSNAARSIQVQVHRNPDGTASLRLSSTSPIQDPFVDLVLDAHWGTGHMVRSYTLLLDPPKAQRTPAPATAAPQVPVAPAPAAVTGRSYGSSNRQPPRAAAPAPRAAAAAPDTAAAASAGPMQVRAGDTAGRLANAHRPSGVSLDQMLVAMLRQNPEAFINGNVNRIRAGAVVQMPTREQALETSRSEASRIVAAQSRDFNAYRRSLASKAPKATVQAADRTSSGQVQAQVSETRPAAETPDKLTLSKGSVQTATAEANLAAQKQADDQASRLSELQRNLTELNELTQSTAAPSAAPATAAAATDSAATTADPASTAASPAAPGVEVSSAALTASPETAASSTEAVAPAASSAAQAPAEPTPTAPAPAAENKAPVAAAPAAPVAPPSVVDDLLDNPLLPAGGGLIALLLGLLGYTAWKRRRAAASPQYPGLGDSQLQPDSFFGSSGGQQVDTSSADTGASTMAYSPSQLDGAGDVDPVAEADVYLAYGRDVQAEEILKEALRTQPERLSIHVKLAEIYVKRQDSKGLEEVARGLQKVCRHDDTEWLRVVEMGRRLDPTNPFFATAAVTPDSSAQPTSAFAAALGAIQPAVAASPTHAAPTLPEAVADLNLDLPETLANEAAPDATLVAEPTPLPMPSDDDFAVLDSQLDVTQAAEALNPPTLVQDTQIATDSSPSASGMDLDLAGFQLPETVSPPAEPASAPPAADAFSSEGLSFDLDPAPAAAADAPAPEAPPASDMEFDLGSLDLDLGDHDLPAASAEPVHNAANDPLSTKLDLAQEFNSIGDSEGARTLIEEVLAEASGPLKDRAQKMLSELD